MFHIFSTKPIPQSVAEYLRKFSTLDIWDSSNPISSEALIERAQNADGLLTMGIRIDGNLLPALPKLRAVSTTSVGYDHFDVEALMRRHIIATHTPGVLDETVADLTFALILSAARRIAELDRAVRKGLWGQQSEQAFFGTDVHHRTLGIIGMGRIGEAVAKRARLGFGMDVLYHNRSRRLSVEQQYDASYVSFEELLRQADFVVLLTPLTDETRGMMNRQAFEMMKSSSIFINVSRGQTVDEVALYEALRDGTIQGAGLDVFIKEPTPATNPLLTLENVIAVPHIGSATVATRDDMAMLGATNLIAVLEGRLTDATVISEMKDVAKEWARDCTL